MTLQLPDSLAERLRERARAQGVELQSYVESVLEEDARQVVTAERLRAFRASTARADALFEGGSYSPIPEGAFSVESLYEGDD